jgi:hypothetical protein
LLFYLRIDEGAGSTSAACSDWLDERSGFRLAPRFATCSKTNSRPHLYLHPPTWRYFHSKTLNSGAAKPFCIRTAPISSRNQRILLPYHPTHLSCQEHLTQTYTSPLSPVRHSSVVHANLALNPSLQLLHVMTRRNQSLSFDAFIRPRHGASDNSPLHTPSFRDGIRTHMSISDAFAHRYGRVFHQYGVISRHK